MMPAIADLKTAARKISALAYEAWDSVDGDDNAMCVNLLQYALNLALAETSDDVYQARRMFEDSTEPYEHEKTASGLIKQARLASPGR